METAISIRPELDESVKLLVEQLTKLRSWAEHRVVANQVEVKAATEDLSSMANLRKAIEAKALEYALPVKAHLNDITSVFKGMLDPLREAVQITKDKVLAYNQEQERLRQEQEEINRMQREAAARQAVIDGYLDEIPEDKPLVAEPPKHIRTDVGMATTTTVWKFEVIDFALLPDQYKLPDMVKIRKVITAGATIVGIRAWQEESLRVTAK